MQKYDTFWRRFFANWVDGLVFTPMGIINAYIGSLEPSATILIIWAIISYSSYWLYSVWMHARYGQTLGKMALGVKVLDITEERIPSLRQAFLRDIGYIVLNTFSLFYLIYLVVSDQYGYNSKAADLPAAMLGLAGASWFLLEIITMATNDKRRAFHDWIAKTVVVRCN